MNLNLIVKIKNKLEEINKQKVSSLLKIPISISIFLLPFIIHYFMFAIILKIYFAANNILYAIPIVLCFLLASFLIVININLLSDFKNVNQIIINKIMSQINKIKVSNILTKDEKEYLKTKNINLLFNYNINTYLTEILYKNISSETSDEEINKIIELFKEEEEKLFDILSIIFEKKYQKENLIEKVYTKDSIYNNLLKNEEIKKIINKLLINKYYKENKLDDLIKYNEYAKNLSLDQLYNLINKEMDLNSIAKVFFVKERNKLNDCNVIKLYDFLREINVDLYIKLKKMFVETILKKGEESIIYDYRDEFLEAANCLNIENKELLYILKEKIKRKEMIEDFKIINI